LLGSRCSEVVARKSLLGSCIAAVCGLTVCGTAHAGSYQLTTTRPLFGYSGPSTGNGNGYQFQLTASQSDFTSSVNVSVLGLRHVNIPADLNDPKPSGYGGQVKTWTWQRATYQDMPVNTKVQRAYTYTGSLRTRCDGGAGDFARAKVTFSATDSPTIAPFEKKGLPGQPDDTQQLSNTPTIYELDAIPDANGQITKTFVVSAAGEAEAQTLNKAAGSADANSGTNTISISTFALAN